MADDATDVVGVYREVLAWVGERLTAIHDSDLSRPTPCEKWDVGDVVVHVLEVIDFYAGLAETGTAAVVAVPRSELVGDAPIERYRRSGARAIDVWSAEGALTRQYRLRAVGPRSGAEILGIHLSDLLIHGWDLAEATGQSTDMDPAVAAIALVALQGLLPPGGVRGAFFGPEQEIDTGADAQQRLLAYSGRHP